MTCVLVEKLPGRVAGTCSAGLLFEWTEKCVEALGLHWLRLVGVAASPVVALDSGSGSGVFVVLRFAVGDEAAELHCVYCEKSGQVWVRRDEAAISLLEDATP